MPMNVISNDAEAVRVSQSTVDFGETGKFEVGVFNESVKNHIRLPAELDKHVVPKHDYKVQEFVVWGASQDDQVKRVQVIVGWFKCWNKAFGIHKKHASQMAQVKNVKPRRRGFYTFLYGGRVNINTFYDYKDQSH